MGNQYQSDLLFKLARQIRMATEFVDKAHLPSEALMTSAELAKLFGIDHEKVKKQIRVLRDLGIIRSIGFSPKRYRFDSFCYRQLLGKGSDNEAVQRMINLMEGRSTESA